MIHIQSQQHNHLAIITQFVGNNELMYISNNATKQKIQIGFKDMVKAFSLPEDTEWKLNEAFIQKLHDAEKKKSFLGLVALPHESPFLKLWSMRVTKCNSNLTAPIDKIISL